MPHLLPTIRNSCPKLRLLLREDLTANLLERLRQRRLDALLLALPVQGDDIQSVELFREPFMVAVPAGHALEQRKQILEHELAGENVLLLEDGHCMRDQALAICGSRTPGQWEELKATSLETLRQMVAAGVGCTLLPALAAMPGVGWVHKGQELVQIRPFAPPVPTRTIGLVWRCRYSRQKTVEHLAEVILGNLPAVVERIPRRAIVA